MGVGAASGCYPKRAEVDKTTLVTRAPAARVLALRAADAGKSAAMPDVMCPTRHDSMETSNVTAASIGLCSEAIALAVTPTASASTVPARTSFLIMVSSAFFGPDCDCSHEI